MTPAQVVDLSAKSENLETQTKRQFVVATVNSLEGYEIEDYAYRLGRAWKLGTQQENDGVLLLVAPNERKVWIATGYGSGGFLTDAMSGVIIREQILPHFKQRPPDYGGGIEAAPTRLSSRCGYRPTKRKRMSRPLSRRKSSASIQAARRCR